MQKALPYIVAGLLAVVIVEAIILFNIRPVTNDKELIDIDRHENEVKALNVTIDALDVKIRELEARDIKADTIKIQSDAIYITKVDSLFHVPLSNKLGLLAASRFYIDSTRAEYLGGGR